MWRLIVLSIWCSVSIFSKTEIYFKPPAEQIIEWLKDAEFPALRLYFYDDEDIVS
ncbi:MAG: hypothetical protein IJS88_00840 [Alphaproteobacteria bacterium]|nr:hypothetical protein [Alphaproteobacteria bacterium]